MDVWKLGELFNGCLCQPRELMPILSPDRWIQPWGGEYLGDAYELLDGTLCHFEISITFTDSNGWPRISESKVNLALVEYSLCPISEPLLSTKLV